MTDQVRYATKDIYADVPEEGGLIRRLVAVVDQPVPGAYAHLVDDADTTTDIPGGVTVLDRSTTARRDTPRPDERSHEEHRETAAHVVGEKKVAGEKPDGDPKPKRPAKS